MKSSSYSLTPNDQMCQNDSDKVDFHKRFLYILPIVYRQAWLNLCYQGRERSDGSMEHQDCQYLWCFPPAPPSATRDQHPPCALLTKQGHGSCIFHLFWKTCRASASGVVEVGRNNSFTIDTAVFESIDFLPQRVITRSRRVITPSILLYQKLVLCSHAEEEKEEVM